MRLSERGLENAAVYYLRRFPSTEENLRRVLHNKVRRERARRDDAPDLDADAVIDVIVKRMRDAGLVDDEGYARGMAESLHRRGMPERAIRQRLRHKGAPREAIDAALERLREQHQAPDEEAAWALARRKRLGPYRHDEEQRRERRERDLGAMARAGYSFALARAVIDAEEPR